MRIDRRRIRRTDHRAGLDARHDEGGFYIWPDNETSAAPEAHPRFATVEEAWADSDAYLRGAIPA